MLFQMLADAVLVLHMAFILFVGFGGYAVVRWPRLAIAHLPALFWGISIELGGWICPLTYVENQLREYGGGARFESSFIEHYLLPVIYPNGLNGTMQVLIAIGLLVVNATLYIDLGRRSYREAREHATSGVTRSAPV